jgi:cyclopropane fatty-acyl-phospholipid synthase-like methyltransferase
MAHTCSWWLNPLFDNPLRRLAQDPVAILEPYLRLGQRVLDLGCGMGYFALAAARLVGPLGTVHAVDLQERSLHTLGRRARRLGLEDRLRLHCQDAADLDIPGGIDAAYAIWVLHEVGGLDRLALRLAGLLRHRGPFLVAEPRIHVSEARFRAIVRVLEAAGFRANASVPIGLSWSIVVEAP